MTTFNSTSQDWFNHIAQNITSNALIQYVLKPDNKIDYQLLEKSVLFAIQTEPIMGCFFVEKEKIPVWESALIKTNTVCCLIKTQNIEDEITSVLKTGLNASNHLPVKICLLDDVKSNVIVVKISHSVCDGSGSKYFIKLLADIYTRLEENESFIPKENHLIRDTGNFYKAFNIKDIKNYFNPEKAELISTWGFPTDENIFKAQSFSYQQLRYKDGEFQQIKQLAGKHNISLNTLLTVAYFMALLHVLKPDSKTKELQFMIDLRKYLSPEIRQNICNLSAILNIILPVQTENFSELLKQTDTAIKDILASDNYIHGTIAGDLAEESGYKAVKDFIKADWENIIKTGNCTPMISNLGILETSIIRFGHIKIKDINLITPAFFAPAFMLGISTYNNILTLNASYYSPGISHSDIKDLLKHINYVLVKNMKQA